MALRCFGDFATSIRPSIALESVRFLRAPFVFLWLRQIFFARLALQTARMVWPRLHGGLFCMGKTMGFADNKS